MIKRILGVAAILCCFFTVFGKGVPPLTPLPLNPAVKEGKLPNGMSYYIMHNEYPKDRANFYIAQKVGSTLEEKDQLGLAHFLEHMAFNGTTHYPGKSMLDYLQNKGIRFGADINAYTAFDETVYNIDNVPTNDKPLMDSVLLVLHDWSCDLLLDEKEIDAERGVIQEEWRQRNDANTRMMSSILPKIYDEYQYEQMPIGKMDVVMNFKPETLRAYYKKWYRPDQQGIVIVGDFDADEMEKKVIEMFSPIKMPENAAERVYPKVSDNEKPIYVSYTDPELTSGRTTIAFKRKPTPAEDKNTLEIYMANQLILPMITSMLNQRLSDNSVNPDCKYAAAGVYIGDFFVSKTMEAFNLVVIPKPGQTKEAVAEAMGIVVRALKKGYTDLELTIVKKQMLSHYEAAYNERSKISNSLLGKELYRYFIDNEPAPGIEKEYEIMKEFLPRIPAGALNLGLSGMLNPDKGMVVVTAEPEKAGFKVVDEGEMIQTIRDAFSSDYEAYEDQVISGGLIDNMPQAGEIKSVKENKAYGAKEYLLGNGVKVIVKATDYADDQILFTAFREGGVTTYPESMVPNVKLVNTVASTAKRGRFDNVMLPKYLAGIKAGLGYSMEMYSDRLNGSSTAKDIKALMELIYVTFTDLNPDKKTFDVSISNLRNSIKSKESNPNTIFGKKQSETLYPGDALMAPTTIETIDKADYDTMFGMVRDAMKNAADYTFVFTGNINDSVFIPYMKKYIASLPASKPRKVKRTRDIRIVPGSRTTYWQQPMQSPGTTVFVLSTGDNVKYNVKNNTLLSMLSDVLQEIYTATLREEEGGTYGAGVSASIQAQTGDWTIGYSFQTNKDQQDALVKRADEELLKLLENGVDPEVFNKVKQAKLKQLEIAERNNGYWHDAIQNHYRGFDNFLGYRKTLENLTPADLNSLMKKLDIGKNHIEIIMEGVAE